MTPWLAKGAHTYKGRLAGEDGIVRVISLRTKNADDAKAIERTLRWLREQRKWTVIQLLFDKTLTAPAVHDAHVGGYLERLIVDATKRQEETVAKAKDPELGPLALEWASTGARPRYVRQVATFLEWLGNEARLSSFRRREIATFLGGLKSRKKSVTGSTKRRYRVALSQFARFLLERELLDTNIVRDVRGAPENRPRMLFHTREEAQALVKVLEGPQQALEALMAGTSMEWGAAIKVRRRDVDPTAKSVWADGGKTEYRQRRVFFTEDWAWSVFWEHARAFTGNASLFDLKGREAIEVHKAACLTARVKVTRIHDWRHTYAIYSLLDGMAPQAVKAQLGHSPNSTMLERVYSAWLPKDPAAYVKRLAATNSATKEPKKSATMKPRGRARAS
jgi:integrase